MKPLRIASLALVPVVLATAIAVVSAPVGASSHREAPLISKDPSVDNTDVYAFVSPDAPNTVTLIAAWIPFEEPGGGPNFYHYDDNARYNIKIDRDGDAKPDITYEWRFKTEIKNTATFLYNNGPITAPDSPTFNYTQYYTVTSILGDNDTPGAQKTVLFGNELMAPDNVGPRSTPSYDALAAKFINTGSGPAAGYKEFTGQREDPFYVDVNSIFDLGGLRPFNSLHLLPLVNTVGLDSTAGYNVHITAIQVPISTLAPDCPANDPGVGGSAKCVIGVWSSADRPTITTRGLGSETGTGAFVQVSRLGMPLTNEVVLPLGLKDAFNGLKPEGDTPLFKGEFDGLFGAPVGQLAVSSVLEPELQKLLPVLYPTAFKQTGADKNLPDFPRTDLLTIFLTGIPGVNAQEKSGNPFADASKIASDQLRLNVAIDPTAAICQGKRLGALEGDFAGFPNGRRLEDDVTDVALRAVAGGYGSVLPPALAPLGVVLPNLSPGNLLSDGVDKNDRSCLGSFPYVGTPHSGYDRKHGAVNIFTLPIISQTATQRGR
ncbi:MAG: DUF4331 domain-containing protein [Roseiflexaceae bacterium]|nr:DUF4331 domain-containing protein [Roseiflexaceae bacterium]